MRRLFRLSLTLLVILVLYFIVGSMLARAVECKTEPDGRAYSQWRSIDGRKCWYLGHRKLSKSDLHWPDKKPERKKMDPVFPIRAEEPGLPAPKTRAPLHSDQPMEIVTDGCCWPKLSEFDLLWDKIMETIKRSAKGIYND